MPSIAVIIPAYNAERFVIDALESVAGQTRTPEEVIVVDDGSTDATAEKVEEYATNSGLPIRLIRQQNGGASAARNTAFLAATSELVAPLDVDDIMLPHHLETLDRVFRVVPNIVVAFGDQKIVDQKGTVLESFLAGKPICREPTESFPGEIKAIRGSAFLALLSGNQIGNNACLIRRNAVLESGLYDVSLRTSEDRDFQLRLSRVGRFAYVKDVLAIRREHSDNLSHPRHMRLLALHAYLCLKKIQNMVDSLDLSADERAKVREKLQSAAADLSYSASATGLPAWLQTISLLVRDGHAALAANPVNWIRAALAPIRRPPAGRSE